MERVGEQQNYAERVVMMTNDRSFLQFDVEYHDAVLLHEPVH